MRRPDQNVYILLNGKSYRFDAVVKVDHQHTMDVADDAKDVEKKEHVNYAVKKPSQLVIEALVSDSVTASNEPLTSGNQTRSVAAYENLYKMQQRRQLLTVYTTKHVYTNMLIDTLAVVEDSDNQNALAVTISFTEIIVKEKPKKKGGSRKPEVTSEDGETAPLESILSSMYGNKFLKKGPTKKGPKETMMPW